MQLAAMPGVQVIHSILLGKQRLKDYKFRVGILGLIEQLSATTMKANPA